MSDCEQSQMERYLEREPQMICNTCKYWLNDTDEVLISVCIKGMIAGSCWFDNSCKKWKLKNQGKDE